MNRLAAIDINTLLSEHPSELIGKEFQHELDAMISRFIEGSMQMLGTALDSAKLYDNKNVSTTVKVMSRDLTVESMELFQFRLQSFNDFVETLDPKFL